MYWRHARRYKKRIFTVYPLMTIAQIVEDFLQPLIVSFILTRLASGDIESLRHSNLYLIIIGVVITELGAHVLWNRVIIPLFWRTQEAVMRDLSMTAFDHLQSMSTRFFADRFAGSLVSQVNKFVTSFERLTDALTWNVFKLLIALVATVIILAPKAPLVSVAIIVISAVYVPLVWKYRKRLLPYNEAWATAESDRTGQLADTISNVMAVKSFSGEKIERKRMKQKVDATYDRSIDTMRLTMRQEFVTGGLQRSINVAVIIISVLLAINGRADVGIIYLSLTFTMTIMRRLWDLNNTFRTLTRVFGDAHDMTEILQIAPGITDPEKPQKLRTSRGRVSFESVVFTHEDSSDPLFNNLSFTIKPGQKIGLVGHSGGGKTTITKLLMRFMDIQGGTISLDGQDITQITQAELRNHIAYVPQEPLLFHRTLAENIAYGRPGATQQEIEAVATMANAAEFIELLPDAYQTLVGERGVKLSGGQRQRIAIARAMLRNAPLLVLDEATSALDSESEALIQDALWRLMEDKTAIVIAHRLSTIQKMDKIIVLSSGKIIEQGTHKELIRNDSAYASLWKRQSGGFIED